ncbi:MAG: hypothetical protein MUO63_05030 [Desulfobulbaceae bacterium]|jgi:hypothetical protein|nr:hypothetical protein [Desulfobulbaceae bacterium]
MKKKKPLRKLPFIVLMFFLILFLAGVISGEPSRILEQSWLICLSCIGIG